MATTTPDNLRTPNPGDPYNLVADLATFAGDVQTALNTRANTYKGTTAQRTAALSTTPVGALWQDTNGTGMIWKRGATAWEPAVWRWAGTTAQMNGFTQAPVGFLWYNSTDSREYVRGAAGWSLVSGFWNSASAGQTAGLSNTGTSLIPVTGGAALTLAVSLATAAQARITVQGNLTSLATPLQIGTNLSGATTYVTPVDDAGVGKGPSNLDATVLGQRITTLNSGSTTLTLAFRGTGTIRNPSITVEVVR